MKCKSKFYDSDKYIYDYSINENDKSIKLSQDQFNMTITKEMFNMFFEPIDNV